MELLAQHGFGNGEKIIRALNKGLIKGAIFSAKDVSPAKVADALEEIEAEHPQGVRMFDPQFYASMIAAQPGARLGYLGGDEAHSYFEPRRRRDLEREQQVRKDLTAVIAYQQKLAVSAIIAPNIVIRRAFDSVEGTVSKNFLRNAAPIAAELGESRPVYATLAISSPALADRIELQNFLQEITEIDEPPTGFYLLLEKPDSGIAATLTEPDILSRWMLVNYILKTSGFRIINGYTDALSPYVGAAGSDAVATGWYNTLKTFSLKKFEPVSEFSRRPVARYLSRVLLKSIRHTELHDLRRPFPEVLNGLSCDDYYDEDEGSAPDAAGEALQNWEGIGLLNKIVAAGDVRASLTSCRSALDRAEELYARIRHYGLTMRDRSGAGHVDMIREELNSFEHLAEL